MLLFLASSVYKMQTEKTTTMATRLRNLTPKTANFPPFTGGLYVTNMLPAYAGEGGGVHWVHLTSNIKQPKEERKFRPDMSAKKNACSVQIRQN